VANRKKIWIVAGIVVLIGALMSAFLLRNARTVFDEPHTLSAKEETITACYINWACDCADFIEQKNFKGEPSEDSCFFIEPADASLRVAPHFYDSGHFHQVLVLTGRFYTRKGISKSYEQKTEEKPEKARVFRYNAIKEVELK
jgi:hypothetical protein